METEEEYIKVSGYVFLYDLDEDLLVVTVVKQENELARLVLTSWDNANPENVFFGWNDNFNVCCISLSSFGEVITIDNSLLNVKENLMAVPGKLVRIKDKTYKIEI